MEVINTSGRRKTAVARVYLKPGNGSITVNRKDYKAYFTTEMLHYTIEQPFKLTNNEGKFDVLVNVKGGGFKGQAEAVRLAISKALTEVDQENRPMLKPEGLLRRDPRMVERKKPGQKKARKRFQFSKR
ncbi:MAG TPA: 30S ribosomal protein S9 [Bacteroidales bacterium]|nr:30S ribosomal protein S9 [Bacteroidales bacterium]HRZ48861.1 30S ribosomal protein S9 [Bacteroidales bacterium]